MSPVPRFARRFFVKAFRDNITGLAAMVAYNLLLSILPLALLALFVFGTVVGSGSLERQVIADLHRIFPRTAQQTFSNVLMSVRRFAPSAGIVGLIASIWIGSSFWGALDTAFSRIYDAPARSWVQQKLFALRMLLVVLLFMAATVAVPTVQSILVNGTHLLPFGLAHIHGLVYSLSLIVGMCVLFGSLVVIYWRVPNSDVPWRAIWPGALGATIAIGIVDYGFPLYLGNVSTIAHIGTTLVFIVIVLLWFYALAIILLGGAVLNELRLEPADAKTAAQPAAASTSAAKSAPEPS
ncbi:MAG TPA: YihY/virulence factor BrkB family protein [Solirubrobacteraceae bacterium]|jgi:YihY family inner membrane protein|nr:YihY/virulence factor BrkB family protein [Solirubrobacteraceae bacterium]